MFNSIIDLLFIIDIVFNFRTSYFDLKEAEEIFEGRKIAIRYLSSGKFSIDLLASIPTDMIIEIFAGKDGSGEARQLL